MDDGDPSRIAALAPQDDAVATRRMGPRLRGDDNHLAALDTRAVPRP